MENRITYFKRDLSSNSVQILSIPWSYLITGLAFFIIGILDFKFLGLHIGHPGESGIGERVGQGTAVFLGGISFAWTTGLAPLITGAIMVIYCIYATKLVNVSQFEDSYTIQERRLLFPFVTNIDRQSIKQITYTNKGLQLRHIWIILFIPLGIRILQFGIPLFNEHLAEDNILPTMMLLTGLINIMGSMLTLLIPTHTLSFQTDTKLYEVNFLPIVSDGNLHRTLELQGRNTTIEEGKRNDFIFRLIGVIVLVLLSSIGISAEFLWGTDLSMVGISYGIFLLFQLIQENFSMYFHHSSGDIAPDSTNRLFRKLTFLDVVAIGLIVYLSTLEILWGWVYLSVNWLTIFDMVITTALWMGILFWTFLYLIIPLKRLKNLKGTLKENKKHIWKMGIRTTFLFLCILFAFIIAF